MCMYVVVVCVSIYAVFVRVDRTLFSAHISIISRELPPATPTRWVIYGCNGRGPQEGPGQFSGDGGWAPRSEIYRQSGEVRMPCSQ